MSTTVGGQIKHAFHHAAHEVEHEVTHDAHQVEHTADQVGDEIQKIIDAGDKQVARLATSTADLLKKAGDEIEKDIEHAASVAVNQLTGAAVQKGLHEAAAVLSLVNKGLKELAKDMPALVNHINQMGDSIVLGPIVLRYQNFYSRADKLLDVINETLKAGFKLTRHFIINLIAGLGPDSIDIDAEIVFFSRFGIDLTNIDIDVFTAIADKVLDELGVPE